MYIVFYGFMIAGFCRSVSLYWSDQNEGGIFLDNLIYFSQYGMDSLGFDICTRDKPNDICMRYQRWHINERYRESCFLKKYLGAFIFVLFLPLMTCVFLSFFIYSYILYIVICTIFIIIYGFYLIWETQLIMGGKV